MYRSETFFSLVEVNKQSKTIKNQAPTNTVFSLTTPNGCSMNLIG